jgi:hypothetical protein
VWSKAGRFVKGLHLVGIRKAKCCYDQSRHKQEPSKDWKRKDKSGFQKRDSSHFPYKNSRKGAQFGQPSRSVHQQNFPSQSGNKPVEKARERVEEPKKGPLQCWGCGEPHLLRDFPHRQHDIRRFIMCRKQLQSMMWPEVCQGYMQLWRIDKKDHQAL